MYRAPDSVTISFGAVFVVNGPGPAGHPSVAHNNPFSNKTHLSVLLERIPFRVDDARQEMVGRTNPNLVFSCGLRQIIWCRTVESIRYMVEELHCDLGPMAGGLPFLAVMFAHCPKPVLHYLLTSPHARAALGPLPIDLGHLLDQIATQPEYPPYSWFSNFFDLFFTDIEVSSLNLFSTPATDIVDLNGNNLLHYAARFGGFQVIMKLKEMGVSRDHCNALGQTPLQSLCVNGRVSDNPSARTRISYCFAALLAGDKQHSIEQLGRIVTSEDSLSSILASIFKRFGGGESIRTWLLSKFGHGPPKLEGKMTTLAYLCRRQAELNDDLAIEKIMILFKFDLGQLFVGDEVEMLTGFYWITRPNLRGAPALALCQVIQAAPTLSVETVRKLIQKTPLSLRGALNKTSLLMAYLNAIDWKLFDTSADTLNGTPLVEMIESSQFADLTLVARWILDGEKTMLPETVEKILNPADSARRPLQLLLRSWSQLAPGSEVLFECCGLWLICIASTFLTWGCRPSPKNLRVIQTRTPASMIAYRLNEGCPWPGFVRNKFTRQVARQQSQFHPTRHSFRRPHRHQKC